MKEVKLKEIDFKTKLKAEPDFTYDEIKYNGNPRPDLLMHISPVEFIHFEVIGTRCRLVGTRYISPLYNKKQASDIYFAMDKVKKEPRKPFSLDYTKVHIRGWSQYGNEVAISQTHCKFGMLSISGQKAFDNTLNALRCFCWGSLVDQRDIVIDEDHDGNKFISHKGHFGDGDKFVWWKLTKGNDGKNIFTVADTFSEFRCTFDNNTMIPELTLGVEKVMGADTEYKLQVEPLNDYNFRVFRTKVDGGCYAVGISTDMLRYSQKAFIFFGEEGGNNFLKFLNEAKKLFK